MSAPAITRLPITADGLAQNAKAVGSVKEACVANAVLEPKLDGWRLLAHIHDDGVSVYSRTAKSYSGRLPEIEQELAGLFPAGTWVDGEAVAIRIEDGLVINDWSQAQSALSSGQGKAQAAADAITFMVFDLIAYDNIDVRPLPFSKRRSALERIFDDEEVDRVQLNAQFEPTDENHEALVSQGFEGSMLKSLDAPYGSGKRGAGWFKLKATATIDAVVMGYKEGKDGFAGMIGAIIFGQYEDGALVERGSCSGMDMKTRKKITADTEGHIGMVIEVAHMGAMPSGGLRHPQFKRWRTDKLAEDCGVHNG
jgi:DNA ligase 1